MIRTLAVILGILFFGLQPAQAAEFKGIALIRIAAKHLKLEMHYAVRLSENDATFAALDDFGGVPFVIHFEGQKMRIQTVAGEKHRQGGKLKSILSLPLTQAELIAVLGGSTLPERKKLRVVQSDFVASQAANPYPLHVLISSKKNEFEFTWVSVSVQ